MTGPSAGPPDGPTGGTLAETRRLTLAVALTRVAALSVQEAGEAWRQAGHASNAEACARALTAITALTVLLSVHADAPAMRPR